MGLFKSKPKQQAPPAVPQNGSQKDRVNDVDKAILDVKARQRKIRTYQDKLILQETEVTDKIKEMMRSGQKTRALILLKQKKFVGKEIEKVQGVQMMLQQTLSSIEQTQADVEVMKALKQGDQVLKDLQKQTSMQDWEELYESHKENQERYNMELEMFGAPLDDDELTDELDLMVANELKQELGELAPMPIIKPTAKQVKQEESSEEEQVAVKPKRQLA